MPAFGGIANLTWWGWTAHHQPLGGRVRLGDRSSRSRSSRSCCSSSGVELFARRDLGVTSRIPWPSHPDVADGPRRSRHAGRSASGWPLAVSWGIGIGLMGFIFGGGVAVVRRTPSTSLSPDTQQIFQTDLPEHRPQRRRRVPPARVRHVRAHPGRVRGRDAGQGLGLGRDRRPARDAARRRRCRAPAGRSRAALGLFAAIGVMTLVIMLGIGIGSALAGGDVATPIVGTRRARPVRARAGRDRARRRRPRDAPRSPARSSPAIVILTFLIDLLAPALKWPDWVHQLALTVAPRPADDRQLGLGRAWRPAS